MKASVQLKSSWRAVVLLWGMLGPADALRAIFGLVRRQLAGEPWRGLPLPQDEKEKLSRKQAGPAVLLYRALEARHGAQRALEVTGTVVLEGSLLFLASVVPRIDPDRIRALSQEARRAFVLGIADRFFNADVADVELTEDSFRYRIGRCRFPELMKAVGHPELAPLFCEGDQVFFDRHQPDIAFTRPVTLSRDNEPCDFNFNLRHR